MKKFTSILIGCSLALAGVAWAQQPETEQSPKGKKQAEKTERAAPKARGENVAKPEATTAVKQHGMKNERAASNLEKPPVKPEGHARTETNVTNETGAKNQQLEEHGMKGKVETEKNMPPTTAHPEHPGMKGKVETEKNMPPTTAHPEHPGMKGKVETEKNMPPTGTSTTESAHPEQSMPTTNQTNRQVNAGEHKKPEREQVQQIKQQHVSFHAQPKPQQAPTVTFNEHYRIEGAERWQGSQYEVFRSYHPERHDRDWYRSHYNRVELIGGGYYYWNNGYWYPAWGYDQSAQYYAYDGPIYVGHSAQPPDQVIADVQSELQQMGYYQGEVDGLLGPMTRQALTAYQGDNGLTPTAAIDEPTLDSLGMS